MQNVPCKSRKMVRAGFLSDKTGNAFPTRSNAIHKVGVVPCGCCEDLLLLETACSMHALMTLSNANMAMSIYSVECGCMGA